MNEVKSTETEVSAGLKYKDAEESRNEINERKMKLTTELMKARQTRKVEQQKTQTSILSPLRFWLESGFNINV